MCASAMVKQTCGKLYLVVCPMDLAIAMTASASSRWQARINLQNLRRVTVEISSTFTTIKSNSVTTKGGLCKKWLETHPSKVNEANLRVRKQHHVSRMGVAEDHALRQDQMPKHGAQVLGNGSTVHDLSSVIHAWGRQER